jgi:hypothetical protein
MRRIWRAFPTPATVARLASWDFIVGTTIALTIGYVIAARMFPEVSRR